MVCYGDSFTLAFTFRRLDLFAYSGEGEGGDTLIQIQFPKRRFPVFRIPGGEQSPESV
jgi:hypothetical protein